MTDLDRYREELRARIAAIQCKWQPTDEQVQAALAIWGGPTWQEEAAELNWLEDTIALARGMLRAGVGEAMDWSRDRIIQLQTDLQEALSRSDARIADALLALSDDDG